MEARVIFDPHTAVIQLGIDLGTLLAVADRRKSLTEMFLPKLEFAEHGFVHGGARRHEEPALLPVAAIDVPFLHGFPDGQKGLHELAVDAGRVVQAVTRDDLAESVLEGAADVARIAGACSIAWLPSVKDGDRATRLGKMKGSGQ